mmetsp:Transcript_95055/g.271808  ORF Transcript_95055/g.271808 Transcript_95055/m.271808 type:complete len:227 (-) Transcript_95055:23-703(-)
MRRSLRPRLGRRGCALGKVSSDACGRSSAERQLAKPHRPPRHATTPSALARRLRVHAAAGPPAPRGEGEAGERLGHEAAAAHAHSQTDRGGGAAEQTVVRRGALPAGLPAGRAEPDGLPPSPPRRVIQLRGVRQGVVTYEDGRRAQLDNEQRLHATVHCQLDSCDGVVQDDTGGGGASRHDEELLGLPEYPRHQHTAAGGRAETQQGAGRPGAKFRSAVLLRSVLA